MAAERRYGISLVDQDRSRTRSQGIITASVGLVDAMGALLEDDERLIVFVNPAIDAELTWRAPRVERRVFDAPSSALNRLRWDNVGVVAEARRERLDVLHFPKGLVPIRRSTATGAAVVATAHDDIPWQYLRGTFGSRSPLAKNAFIAVRLWWTLRTADVVITDSRFSAGQLRRMVPRSEPRVIALGVTGPTNTGRRPRRHRPSVVVSCSALPHKQTRELISMTEAARRSGLDIDPVAVGELPAGLTLPDGWTQTAGVLSTEGLHERIRSARALVFGSAYEGFGLPPLEAWCLRTPAVFPRIPSLVEHLGEVPGSFAPGDVDSFIFALRELLALSDDDVESVASRLESRFTWARAASETLEVYREAARGRSVAR